MLFLCNALKLQNYLLLLLTTIIIKLHFVKYQPFPSRRLRWAGHVARMGERRGAYRALVGKPEGRRPIVRYRLRWVDNIKMDLR
jgi:hypothetical protein